MALGIILWCHFYEYFVSVDTKFQQTQNSLPHLHLYALGGNICSLRALPFDPCSYKVIYICIWFYALFMRYTTLYGTLNTPLSLLNDYAD